MKKILSLLLALTMIFSLCACVTTEQGETDTSAAEESVDRVVNAEDVPIVGSWINEIGKNCFRFNEDGSSLMEAVATKTDNNTGEKSFIIYQSREYTWSVKDGKFYLGESEYTPVENNGTYKLVGEKVTYIRVGDLDYKLDLIFNVK